LLAEGHEEKGASVDNRREEDSEKTRYELGEVGEFV
jgi:hypothetical protein